MYGLKDLKDDIKKGIYNVPSEIIAQIPEAIDAQRNIDLTALLASPVFAARVNDVVTEQKENLACLEEKLQHMDLGINKMCGGLLPEIHAFVDEFDLPLYLAHIKNA